ncbi:hypothetical protein FQA39_LY14825 [Lamprigera yunnana]|nr:hypothetical protein FQA39_LY14825 [Lamprigera yunnana]
MLLGRALADNDNYYYLPKIVKPILYYLVMEPHSDESFTGSVSIYVKALEDSYNVTLHSKDLAINVKDVKLYANDNVTHKVSTLELDKENQICTIHLKEKLRKHHRYRLVVEEFKGTLNHEKLGFFLAKYRDKSGNERSIALTYFEPNGARMAFPCFDEPALKARFVVNLVRKNTFHTVSNEELRRSIYLGDGRIRDVYKETVPMSTYLVAFAIIDYSFTRKNNRIRVLARKEAISRRSTDYVLDESVKMLRAMEEYTGIGFVFDKIDLLGVPSHYFIDGAMENWGLVMYNEQHLLYLESSSTTEDLQRCATYTAHELSHQWFGNLVTPSKWNYMWLSEGFAAYFQYHIADVVEPLWRLKEQFVVEELHKSLTGDLEPMAQPLNFVFNDPSEFPSPWIYYNKASSIIRMTEHFLTSPIFRKGLRLYLEKKKFSSSVPEDLYASLQKAVNLANAQHLIGTLTVSQILSTWDTNVGYPLVTATRDYVNGTITIKQETYSTNDEMNDNIWMIPISYATSSDRICNFSITTANFWLTTKSITFSNFKHINWILLNKQHSGYFRINYDDVNWYRLIKFLKTSKYKSIHVLNRAQLINDAFQMVEDGKLSAKIALDLSGYIRQERDFIALKPFLKRIDSFDFMVSITNEYKMFQIYVKHLLSLTFDNIGIEEKLSDSHVDRLNRAIVSRRMCLYGDYRCQNYGVSKLREWKETELLKVPFELEYVVLCGAMQVAEEKEWKFLLERYYQEVDKGRKNNYIKALGCSSNPDIIQNFLNLLYDFQNPITIVDRLKGVVNIVETRIINVGYVFDYFTTKTIVNNSSFEAAVSGETINQIVSSKFTKQIELLKKSGNTRYIPVSFFTEDYLETYENVYINEVSEWLLNYSNFI